MNSLVGQRLSECLRLILPVALISVPAAATAQSDPSAAAPRARTGPGAEPAPLPGYAQPTPPPLTAPADQPAPPSVAMAETAPITRVRIVSDVPGSSAVPPEGWAPPQDPSGGVALTHRPGQPLDLAWSQDQFERAMAGGSIRASTAVSLVQLLNRAYITAGFINSGLVVPPQTDRAAGILDLRLIFGRLAAADESADPIAVEWGKGGRAGLSPGYVRRRFPSARQQPLSAVAIERDFRLLTEDPMIGSISAALRPGNRAGEASLTLAVQPAERFDVYFGAANDRSPSVGSKHVFAGGFLKSLLVSGDLLTAEGGLTRGVEDAQVAYTAPLFSGRTALLLRGSFNNAAVIDRPLLPLDIRARDRSAEAGVTHRLLQVPLMPGSVAGRWSASETLTAGVLLAYRQQKSFLFGQPFSFAPGSVDGRTEYRAARLTADYVARNVTRVIALSVTTTVGLGGTQSNIPSIPNPDDHFFAMLAQFNLAQRLNRDGLELRVRVTGQNSAGILYSGERLSVGGINSVRGYRESLFLVDRGLIGTAELAYPFSLSKQRTNNGVDWGAFTGSVFADAAVFKNAEPPQPARRFISSVGASLAWNPSPAFRAVATYGLALQDATTPQNRDLQDRGWNFRVVVHPLRLF